MGKIRFAVMINGNQLRKWQAECIEKILSQTDSELVAYISNPSSIDTGKPGFAGKLFRKNALYSFLLNRMFKVPSDTLAGVDPEIAFIECTAERKGKYSDYFNDEDIALLKNMKLDFILRFGYNILRGDVLQTAKFGIWSYHHGDERAFRGGPPAFWEIIRKAPSTGVVFQKLTSKLDSGCILLRRDYITVFHSFREMRQRLLAENTDMPFLAVRKYIINAEPVPESTESQAKIFHIPGNFRTLWFLIQLCYNRIIFYLKREFLYEKWGLVYGQHRISQSVDFLNIENKIYNCKQILSEEKYRFFADPFVLQSGSDVSVVFENFSYKSGLGHLSVWDRNSGVKDLMIKPIHMSFPFVFRHKEALWIIPEESENNHCYAYEWSADGLSDNKFLIINQAVVDPVLMEYDGMYYLFCGLKNDLPNEKLFVFYSESFNGPYKPHFLNPVKVSAAGSRNAGNFISLEGDMLRPSQVYKYFYGHNMLINRVVKLSPQQFNEVEFASISPKIFSQKSIGTHTFSLSGDHFVADVKTHRFGFYSSLLYRRKKYRKEQVR